MKILDLSAWMSGAWSLGTHPAQARLMSEIKSNRDELKENLIKALVSLRVRSPDFWYDLEYCLWVVEETDKLMPPRPMHLQLVPSIRPEGVV